MTACRGCDSRLGKPTGSSGFCDPCFIVVRLEKLVFTRAPYSATQLFHYLRKVCDAVEETCEKYESDRTAGYYVDSAGAPVSDSASGKPPGGSGPDPFQGNIRVRPTRKQHPRARP